MAIPSSNSLSWLPAAFTGANAGLDALKLENIEFKNLIYSPGDDPDSGGLGEESYKGGWRDGQVKKTISIYLHKAKHYLHHTIFRLLTLLYLAALA